MLIKTVSHSWEAETDEVKAAWFQSLSFEERMSLLVEFTDLVLQNQPRVWEQSSAESSPGRIRVLSLP